MIQRMKAAAAAPPTPRLPRRVVVLLDEVEEAVIVSIVESHADHGVGRVQVQRIQYDVARRLRVVVLLPQRGFDQLVTIRFVVETRYIYYRMLRICEG